MSVRKRKKKNRFRQKKRKPLSLSLLRGGVAITGIAAGFILSALFFIFVHDAMTQSDFFNARAIHLAGNSRLTEATVFSQAGVTQGLNVLSVNLTLVRKKLLAHPWIAEATAARELPGELDLSIREHKAVAIAKFSGSRFLVNREHAIFKEASAGDPEGLPVIEGLAPKDFRITGKLRQAFAEPAAAGAVFDLLTIGSQKNAVLPNRLLARVTVDRELGPTLHPSGALGGIHVGSIRMGYDNYREKLARLNRVLTHLTKQGRDLEQATVKLEYIDLDNIDRIVVKPVREGISPKEPEGGLT